MGSRARFQCLWQPGCSWNSGGSSTAYDKKCKWICKNVNLIHLSPVDIISLEYWATTSSHCSSETVGISVFHLWNYRKVLVPWRVRRKAYVEERGLTKSEASIRDSKEFCWRLDAWGNWVPMVFNNYRHLNKYILGRESHKNGVLWFGRHASKYKYLLLSKSGGHGKWKYEGRWDCCRVVYYETKSQKKID